MVKTESTLDLEQTDVALINMYGNIQQEETDELEEQIVMALEEGKRKFVLDLTNVNNICSSSLGMLASYQKSLKVKRGDGFRLVITNPNLLELLKVTMLHKAFDIYEIPEDAMRSFY